MRCPNDQQELNISESKRLVRGAKFVTRMILNMNVKCPFKTINKETNEEKLSQLVEDKDKDKDNNYIQCTWRGLLKQYLEEHVNECPYRPQKCKYCGMKVFQYDLDKHYKNECQEYEIDCPYLCNKKIKRKLLTKHYINCSHRPHRCINNGCPKSIPFYKFDQHIKKECLYRIEECPYKKYGCKVAPNYSIKVLQHHLKVYKTQHLQIKLDYYEKKSIKLEKKVNHLEQITKNYTNLEENYTKLFNIITKIQLNLSKSDEKNHIHHEEEKQSILTFYNKNDNHYRSINMEEKQKEKKSLSPSSTWALNGIQQLNNTNNSHINNCNKKQMQKFDKKIFLQTDIENFSTKEMINWLSKILYIANNSSLLVLSKCMGETFKLFISRNWSFMNIKEEEIGINFKNSSILSDDRQLRKLLLKFGFKCAEVTRHTRV